MSPAGCAARARQALALFVVVVNALGSGYQDFSGVMHPGAGFAPLMLPALPFRFTRSGLYPPAPSRAVDFFATTAVFRTLSSSASATSTGVASSYTN